MGPALAAAARAEHAGGRTVHVPVGVLEGASGICGHAGRRVGATRPMGSDAQFACAMEDILEVYHREYQDDEVLVCMDETHRQQVKEVRVPRPAEPGTPATYDYEYERNGVSNLFMLFAPLEGWRRVDVTKQRTKVDWARQIQRLVDEDYPDKRVVLVMDNLNTHAPASFYEAFEPAEARRIAERLEIHYTPKHGSWLNMAEIEIGAMVGQCLNRRLPDREPYAVKSMLGRGEGTAKPCEWTGDSRPPTHGSN